MKFMRKDALQFYIKVLRDNDFPKYGEYQMNGSKWLDRILKDTSLPCEKRIAAGELGLIVYNIIGGNGGGQSFFTTASSPNTQKLDGLLNSSEKIVFNS